MLRKILFVFTFNLLLVSAFMPVARAAQSQIVILNVPGMTCKFCPITIRKALEKVPGVSKVEADFDSKSATVTSDPDKTGVEALIRATANVGYPSTARENH